MWSFINCTLQIIRMFKSRMRWTGRVSRIRKINELKMFVSKSKGNTKLVKTVNIWEGKTM
jgi:hypothetical protein